MKKENWIRFDHLSMKITLSQGFVKRSAKEETEESKKLLSLRKESPTYEMIVKTISKKEGKKTYKHVTYKNMRGYISALEGEDSVNIENFNRLIASKVQRSPYSFARKWFVSNYPDYTDPEQLVTRIEEVIPHEVEPYIEEMEKASGF